MERPRVKELKRRVAERSLVLNVQRTRKEPEDFVRREQRVALFHVVVKEDLESRVLDGLRDLVVTVRVELEPGRSPAVHVHDDLHLWRRLNRGGVEDHLSGEAMDDEHLRRKVLLFDELRQRLDRV